MSAGTLNELEALKTSHVADKARVRTTYDQQKTNALAIYRQAVITQMLAAQKTGDLDSYLDFQNEKKRLEIENSINTNDVPSLKPLVAQYHKAIQATDSTRDKAHMNALRQHVGRLTTLMQNLTRANRLEDAMLVRDVLREAKTELTFLEADTPEEVPKPLTNAPPQPAYPPTPPPPAAVDDLAKNIPGTWRITWRNAGRSGTDTIVLYADGSTSAAGQWEIKNKQCLIHLPTIEVSLNTTGNPKMLMGHNRAGAAITAFKIADP